MRSDTMTHHDRDRPATTERFGPMTDHVVAFLGRLRRIPAEQWAIAAARDAHMSRPGIDATASPIDVVTELGADGIARAHLRDAMDAMPDVVERIRRRIDDELSILDGIVPPLAAARMRRAARLAACALAARPLLSPTDFDRLYRPFEGLIPVSGLGA